MKSTSVSAFAHRAVVSTSPRHRAGRRAIRPSAMSSTQPSARPRRSPRRVADQASTRLNIASRPVEIKVTFGESSLHTIVQTRVPPCRCSAQTGVAIHADSLESAQGCTTGNAPPKMTARRQTGWRFVRTSTRGVEGQRGRAGAAGPRRGRAASLCGNQNFAARSC